MAAFCQSAGVHLRPHVKTHKCTELAHRQLAAGAHGITCAKVCEAEVMAGAGINDILIANQIVGPQKIARLVQIAKQASVAVAVDNPHNVEALGQQARESGVQLRVLIEVNIGMNRCRVEPGQAVDGLRRKR